MRDIQGRRIVLTTRPQGVVKPENFRLELFDLPEPKQGELQLATRFLSLDPYMRGRMDDRKSYASPVPIDSVMEGEVIAEVVASRNQNFAEGDLVLTKLGWTTHGISGGTGLAKVDERCVPSTTALGVLGMPGLTAYAGLLDIGRPKPGETVVVAAASGPVGSLVGQLARIGGARAVGIAGGSEKCAFVKDDLGFEDALDHRSATFAKDLAAACPNGIDVYFELVGGPVWRAVLPLLNRYARVPVCGLVSQYNGTNGAADPAAVASDMREVLTRSLLLQGFIVYDLQDRQPAFMDDVSGWIADGRVRFREDVIDGLENAPNAFIGLLEGRNFGKLLVRI